MTENQIREEVIKHLQSKIGQRLYSKRKPEGTLEDISAEEQRRREMYRDITLMCVQDVIAELESDKSNVTDEWTDADEALLSALRDPTTDVYQDAVTMGIADQIAELEADRDNPDIEWTEDHDELLDVLRNPPSNVFKAPNFWGKVGLLRRNIQFSLAVTVDAQTLFYCSIINHS